MLSSKIKTLLTEGIEPLIEGKHNFENPNHETESLANERTITCIDCRYFKDEPIDFLQIKDNNIPDISGKSCGKCGCILPYKLRQSKSICKRWQK